MVVEAVAVGAEEMEREGADPIVPHSTLQLTPDTKPLVTLTYLLLECAGGTGNLGNPVLRVWNPTLVSGRISFSPNHPTPIDNLTSSGRKKTKNCYTACYIAKLTRNTEV